MAPKSVSTLRPPSDASSESSEDPTDNGYHRLLDAFPELPLDDSMRQSQPDQFGFGASVSMHAMASENNSRRNKTMKHDSQQRRSRSDHGRRHYNVEHAAKTKQTKRASDLESYPSFSEDSIGSVSTEFTSNTISGLDQFDRRVKEMLEELQNERSRLVKAYQHARSKDDTRKEDSSSRRSRSFSPRNLLRKVSKRLHKSVELSPRSPRGVDSPMTTRGNCKNNKFSHNDVVTTEAAASYSTGYDMSGTKATALSSTKKNKPRSSMERKKESASMRSERLYQSPGSPNSKKRAHSSHGTSRQHRSLSPRPSKSRQKMTTKNDSTRQLLSSAKTLEKHHRGSNHSPKKSKRSSSGKTRHSHSPRKMVKGIRIRKPNDVDRDEYRSLSPNKMGRNESLTWTSTHSNSSNWRTRYSGPETTSSDSIPSRATRSNKKSKSLPSETASRRGRHKGSRDRISASRTRRPTCRSISTQTDDSILFPKNSDALSEEMLQSTPIVLRQLSKSSQIRPTSTSISKTSTHSKSSQGSSGRHNASFSSQSTNSKEPSSRSSQSRLSLRNVDQNRPEKARPKQRDFIDSIDWRALSPQIHEGQFLRQSAAIVSFDEEEPSGIGSDRLENTDRTLELVRQWSRKHNGDFHSQNSHQFHDSQPSLQSKSLHSSMSRLSIHKHNGSMEEAKYKNSELRRSNSLGHDLLRAAASSDSKELTLDIFQF